MEQTASVALTVAIVQAIKIADPTDRFKKAYPIMAIIVGLLIGALLSTDQTIIGYLQAGIANAAYSSLAWAAKKAVLDPIGAKLPGDSK